MFVVTPACVKTYPSLLYLPRLCGNPAIYIYCNSQIVWKHVYCTSPDCRELSECNIEEPGAGLLHCWQILTGYCQVPALATQRSCHSQQTMYTRFRQEIYAFFDRATKLVLGVSVINGAIPSSFT